MWHEHCHRLGVRLGSHAFARGADRRSSPTRGDRTRRIRLVMASGSSPDSWLATPPSTCTSWKSAKLPAIRGSTLEGLFDVEEPGHEGPGPAAPAVVP